MRNTTCIECNVAFAPHDERFLINDRHWCAKCAAPYRTTAIGGALRDVGMFGVATVAALAAFTAIALTPISRLAIPAGAFVFVSVLFSWFMRHKVHVERVEPDARARMQAQAQAQMPAQMQRPRVRMTSRA